MYFIRKCPCVSFTDAIIVNAFIFQLPESIATAVYDFNAILITSPMALTLDIALCGQETSTAVAVRVLSVVFSHCGCRRVSNMCLLKRAPLHKPRNRHHWRRMTRLLFCKLRRVCGQAVTLKEFPATHRGPFAFIKKLVLPQLFPLKMCTIHKEGTSLVLNRV